MVIRCSRCPRPAPKCGGKINYSGFGTQRVEEELSELLPGARILRMDQDSTSRKDAHETMLAQFARHDYDILLGTQMVAKGLDFEKVTLVGVLGIDSLLFGQGFRAYESVFSLITQVVGRGGRAELPGRALIQTSVPDHPVLQLAAAQDYEGFLPGGDHLPQVWSLPAVLFLCGHRLYRRSGRRCADCCAAFRRTAGESMLPKSRIFRCAFWARRR